MSDLVGNSEDRFSRDAAQSCNMFLFDSLLSRKYLILDHEINAHFEKLAGSVR